jgi:4-hydroxy-3-polyprenylbenzoate decarboxylase
MPYRDLREFLQRVEDIGDMARIEDADWDLEIGTMTELMCERKGPLLFFDKIKGYPKGFRIAGQPYSSPKRTALMLEMPTNLSPLEIVDRWRVRLRDQRPVLPRLVSSGPVTENVLTGEDIDLLKFPAPKWHELDGGRYLGTGCVFITEDINRQWINLGTYRVQIHDRETTGVSIAPSHHGMLMMRQYWSAGKSCPVAVAMGPPPAVFLAGVSYFPWGTGEYGFAGWANGEPIEIVEGPHTRLPLPAASEIIIEGEVPPPSEETRIEGPFGEYTGYYASGPAVEPVIKVKTLLHRNNPIIQGNPPMKPPISHLGAPIAHAPIWDRLEKSLPGIKALYAHPAGGGGHLYVVSIQQKYAGHAKQVGLMTMGTGASGGRYVVLTDDDIDPSNMDEVMWAVATRCDPATAISIIDDMPSNILDPAMEPIKKKKFETLTNTRAIINACRPYGWIKEFPPVNRASEEMRKRVLDKWKWLFDV